MWSVRLNVCGEPGRGLFSSPSQLSNSDKSVEFLLPKGIVARWSHHVILLTAWRLQV